MHDTEGDHGQQLAAARGLASSPTDSQAACMAGETDVDTVWVHCVAAAYYTLYYTLLLLVHLLL